MAKRLQEYVKYTSNELDLYTKTEGSCVQKINSDLHISIKPYALANFSKALLQHITQSKIGYYNLQLEGIVLDIKNIKVLGTAGALRFDDPTIHVDINADCYVFRPIPGAVLSGIVKHISNKHVGAIIYRVFSATIRFFDTLTDDDVEIDKEIKFRINDFNMLDVFPYIEGELLTHAPSENKLKDKYIKTESAADSGIEEKESTNELDELISLIKGEPVPGNDSKRERKKGSKRKHSLELKEIDSDKDQLNNSTTKTKRKKKKSDREHIVSVKQETQSNF